MGWMPVNFWGHCCCPACVTVRISDRTSDPVFSDGYDYPTIDMPVIYNDDQPLSTPNPYSDEMPFCRLAFYIPLLTGGAGWFMFRSAVSTDADPLGLYLDVLTGTNPGFTVDTSTQIAPACSGNVLVFEGDVEGEGPGGATITAHFQIIFGQCPDEAGCFCDQTYIDITLNLSGCSSTASGALPNMTIHFAGLVWDPAQLAWIAVPGDYVVDGVQSEVIYALVIDVYYIFRWFAKITCDGTLTAKLYFLGTEEFGVSTTHDPYPPDPDYLVATISTSVAGSGCSFEVTDGCVTIFGAAVSEPTLIYNGALVSLTCGGTPTVLVIPKVPLTQVGTSSIWEGTVSVIAHTPSVASDRLIDIDIQLDMTTGGLFVGATDPSDSSSISLYNNTPATNALPFHATYDSASYTAGGGALFESCAIVFPPSIVYGIGF